MPTNDLSLTTPDLVTLSLLAERPMHGYEVNAELERRQARDWVAISRPQIYYSLDKLTRHGLLTEVASSEPLLGADRRVLRTSAKGRRALARSLQHEDWTTERDQPAFLTWLALSRRSQPRKLLRQIRRRIRFLESELAREEGTLRVLRRELGGSYHEAVWMIDLTIAQFKTELRWLKKLDGSLLGR